MNLVIKTNYFGDLELLTTFLMSPSSDWDEIGNRASHLDRLKLLQIVCLIISFSFVQSSKNYDVIFLIIIRYT